MNQKTEITIPIIWLKGLKEYAERVKETENMGNLNHETAIASLLGYLESLEMFYDQTN